MAQSKMSDDLTSGQSDWWCSGVITRGGDKDAKESHLQSVVNNTNECSQTTYVRYSKKNVKYS